MAVCNVRALEVATTGRSELMSLVYRIQSKQDRTRGAYTAGWKYIGMTRNKHPQPTPHEDTGRYISPNEFCGFASAADLLRWFGGAIPAMLRDGLEIVALRDVTITAVGKYQVLFKWRS